MEEWNSLGSGAAVLALGAALVGPGCGPLEGGGGGGRRLALRPAKHAGAWYPGRPEELRRTLEGFLGAAEPAPGKPVRAEAPLLGLIAPHAGVRFSGAVAGQAFRELRGQPVERVFLLGPSHYQGFRGVALPPPELDGYDTPLGPLLFDRDALGRLRGRKGFRGPESSHFPEHSLELEAIFLRHVLPREARLVPLVVGELVGDADPGKLAVALRPLLGPGDVVVVSSDFTHYGARFGYLPFRERVPENLEALLEEASGLLRKGDREGFEAYLERTEDTICGREPVRLLLSLLEGSWSAEERGRDTSGNMTGDFENSVSYLSLVYRQPGGWSPRAEPGSEAESEAISGAEAEPVAGEGAGEERGMLTPEEGELALSMARRALVDHVHGSRPPGAEALGVPAQGAFREPGAVFVTLERPDGSLRGCIGSILAHRPLWEDIRENAASAATRDPRFPPVRAHELEGLELSVTVLTRPVEVDGPEDFEVGRHGVLLHRAGRRAVFLPQVATEQGWDRETTLTQLSLKAGLAAGDWKLPGTRFEVFEAQVLGKDRD